MAKSSENAVKLRNLKPFKKGQSGNPKGKTKGTLSHATVLKQLLNAQSSLENPLTDKKQRMTYQKAIAAAQIKKALAGDTQAYKTITEITDGKPNQSVDMNVEGKISFMDFLKATSE